jgi:hypothetical protein
MGITERYDVIVAEVLGKPTKLSLIICPCLGYHQISAALTRQHSTVDRP